MQIAKFYDGVEFPKFPGMNAEAAAKTLAKQEGGEARQVWGGWIVEVEGE